MIIIATGITELLRVESAMSYMNLCIKKHYSWFWKHCKWHSYNHFLKTWNLSLAYLKLTEPYC